LSSLCTDGNTLFGIPSNRHRRQRTSKTVIAKSELKNRHREERSDVAIQLQRPFKHWIATLRSQ
jgi:hypothetical protein